ncbi:MAG: recombinase family protein, partial [Acidimicrobiales bacterium]
SGPRKGELAWMPLRHWRVLRTLHNPRYAGAFAYGQSRGRKTPEGRMTVEKLPREQWTALIHDAHPGYISWETFEANQQALALNAAAHARENERGPAREGPALLQGLAICGRCGRRMTIGYHLRGGVEVPDYRCMGQAIQTGSTPCHTVPGATIDPAISQLLLDTVTPVALEVALKVEAELEGRAEEADALRRSHVERARHRADLARRRYLAVDPDNRLVADSLEADWNDTLRELNDANDQYQRTATGRVALDDAHKARIRALATDFPRLWNDPATPVRERKRIARLLIEDVTINKTDQIHLHVRFRGGQTTSLVVPIPLAAYQARQTQPDTLAELDRLLDTHTDAQAADALNAAGHRSGTGEHFTPNIVLHLRRSNGLPSHLERLRTQGLLTITELADSIGVHPSTIKAWHRAGLVSSHQANDKNIRLFDPPTPGDPRYLKRQGIRFDKRPSTPPSTRSAI